MINGGVTLTEGGCNWFSIRNHILEKGNNPSVRFQRSPYVAHDAK
jgi:hypothetical protein